MHKERIYSVVIAQKSWHTNKPENSECCVSKNKTKQNNNKKKKNNAESRQTKRP